jgi:hypothetical protein
MGDTKPFTKDQIQQSLHELDQRSTEQYGLGLVEIL